MTPQSQRVHLVPKCWSLNTMIRKREAGLFGEVVELSGKGETYGETAGSCGVRR